MSENVISGFKIRAGCFSKAFGDFVLADEKNCLRLFDIKKGVTVVKVKRIANVARCFAFEDASVAFFTFRNHSLLVRFISFR